MIFIQVNLSTIDHASYILSQLEKGKGRKVVVYFNDVLKSKRYNPPWKRDGAKKLLSNDEKERTQGKEILRRVLTGEDWETVRTYNRIVGKLRDYKKEIKLDNKDLDKYSIEFELMVILENEYNPKEILEQTEKGKLDDYNRIAKNAFYREVVLKDIKDVVIIE